jgi:hypothetical protein
MRPVSVVLAAALAAAPALAAAADAPVNMVACAPGYPGTTAEAQPSMDAFAAAVANAAGWPPGRVVAVYAPTEKQGLAAIRDAAVALVPLPFLVQDGAALGLTPRLLVEQKGLGPTERWTLVAKKGRVTRPADLAGMTVVSIAGYAPGFVRGVLGTDWRLPAATQVTESAQVLSALRRAVNGEPVAVLLDGAQGNALATLPFAAELDVLARSQPLPAAVVATVAARPGAARWAPLEKALLSLPGDPAGAAALEGIRMVRFMPVTTVALEAVRQLASPAR